MSPTDRVTALLPWCERAAFRIAGPRAEVDDLAQEAALAMWRAATKAEAEGREATDAYLKQAGRWAILKYLGRPTDRPTESADLDEALGGRPDPDASGAYHADEVATAVRALPAHQREYVYARFWLDHRHAERRAGGMTDDRWIDARHGARMKLRTSLAHLQEVAV